MTLVLTEGDIINRKERVMGEFERKWNRIAELEERLYDLELLINIAPTKKLFDEYRQCYNDLVRLEHYQLLEEEEYK